MKKYIGILVLVTILIWIIYNYCRTYGLEKNHKLSSGYVYQCINGGIKHVSSIFINYTVTLDGRIYNGSSLFSTNEFSLQECQEHLVGHSFPVAYQPTNPNNSILLLNPTDFKRYDYPFPDSLHWLTRYIKK